MTAPLRVRIMDAAAVDRALTRIAREIVEMEKSLSGLAVIGVQTRGVPLAERLAAKLKGIGAPVPPVGVLDINLYRDDLSRIGDRPILRKTDVPFDLEDRAVVLVDDVLYTGRTVRAALEALLDMGRPRLIRLAVLVDRGHRELPIRADFVGKEVPTARSEQVEVLVRETDGADEVAILKKRRVRRTRQERRGEP